MANRDNGVHAIVVEGAGRAFCSGYDLLRYAEGKHPANQPMPWDPLVDFEFMSRNTEQFMSLHTSPKPTIAKVHGFAVAGGSDIALCADMVVMADDARIGYPPARVWGCPTTAMWVWRVGAERAKHLLFTGELISGVEAARIGLVLKSVPPGELDAEVDRLAKRVASVPRNQLAMQKMVVNQALEMQGLRATQRLATLLDGVARNTPEGVYFREKAARDGFQAAIQERDGGGPIAEGVSRASIPVPLEDEGDGQQ